ncbi:LysR family transcriptional regulator [Zymomonas mobilis]|uniref:LysR family transcriptional regulator n=1 Tax=Zymomonas mobilis TaxID=542 RepID=UPI0039ECE6EE
MRREDLVDLNVFMTVARELSFTRAAAHLGTSQSTLSYTVRRLEERLGIRLLSRTTRQVALTEAGERLLTQIGPAMDTIDTELKSLSMLQEKPSGTVRLTLSEHAANTVVWPVFERILPEYPDIHVELSVDSGMVDIVADRFDAGVRLGDTIAKDMIATRIGPDLRMVIVGAPEYLRTHTSPQRPQDLASHQCINQRMQTSGSLYAWELEKDGQEIRVRVDGQLVFSNTSLIVKAALAGFGLAFVMEDHVREHLREGKLVQVMADWCPSFPGYYLYYPSRRQHSAAFSVLLRALHCRA